MTRKQWIAKLSKMTKEELQRHTEAMNKAIEQCKREGISYDAFENELCLIKEVQR